MISMESSPPPPPRLCIPVVFRFVPRGQSLRRSASSRLCQPIHQSLERDAPSAASAPLLSPITPLRLRSSVSRAGRDGALKLPARRWFRRAGRSESSPSTGRSGPASSGAKSAAPGSSRRGQHGAPDCVRAQESARQALRSAPEEAGGKLTAHLHHESDQTVRRRA